MPQLRLILAVLAALSLPTSSSAQELADDAYKILKEKCQVCHGAAMQQSRLDLRTRDKVLKGGERGKAVTVGNLKRSWLWRLVTHQAKPAMPPGGKLPDEDIEVLRRWIEGGAPFPENAVTDEEAERLAALKQLEDRPITEEEKSWWAFRPLATVAPPTTNDHPIDSFLSAAIETKGLQPAPAADKRQLVRRLYLDLHGLPPTPDQVEQFVGDSSPKAWEALMAKLLASPHYGERWGRHWLDLVHYADSGGYERDFDWPTMWRYRDYVVKAFNSDKPYDAFIREQIAGDEVDPGNPEAHVATGFMRMVLDNNIKDERTRMDELDDNVATTSQTFLGMTVQCARCHNHKFDPIPQKDYYQMQAVFFSTRETDYPLVPDSVVKAYEAADQAIDDQVAPLRQREKALEKPYREKLFQQRLDELAPYYREAWETPADERDEGQRLNARQVEALFSQVLLPDVIALMTAEELKEHGEIQFKLKALGTQRPVKYETARTITEASADPLPSYFLHRGDANSKGSLLDPGSLTVANWQPVTYQPPPPDAKTSHRRRQFADWISSEKNPLTARVMVNRIWQHHFGEGLVRTVSNFGTTGEKPSHPELLDWLATEFIRSGWSVKHMHRLMLTSDAYRRSSDDVTENLAADSDNRYVWRMPRKRLEAEIIRDQILAVADTLDRTQGGPSVRPFIDPDLWQSSTSRVWGGSPIGSPDTWRRSVYVFNKRSIRYPMFEAFDQPDMMAHCSTRTSSTVAPQALLLMNNPEIMIQAKYFAQRLALDAGPDAAMQVDRAFQLALSRSPKADEKQRAIAFIESSPTGLVDFCQTVFNLNEFIYRP